MKFTKQHLLEMINIITNTHTLVDTICSILCLQTEHTITDPFYQPLETYLVSIAHKTWEPHNDTSTLSRLLAGTDEYRQYTAEERLVLLVSGPVCLRNRTFKHTEFTCDSNFYYEFLESYKLFASFKKSLLRIINGNTEEPSEESVLSSIERSYIYLVKFNNTYQNERTKVISVLNDIGSDALQACERVFISELPMTPRLLNILQRSGIFYLDQVASYPKETIMKFRNMGEGTYKELQYFCSQCGIHIYNHTDIEDTTLQVTFQPNHYEKIFYAGIKDKQDVINTDKAVFAELFGVSSTTCKKLIQIQEREIQKRKLS